MTESCTQTTSSCDWQETSFTCVTIINGPKTHAYVIQLQMTLSHTQAHTRTRAHAHTHTHKQWLAKMCIYYQCDLMPNLCFSLQCKSYSSSFKSIHWYRWYKVKYHWYQCSALHWTQKIVKESNTYHQETKNNAQKLWVYKNRNRNRSAQV